MTREVFIRCMSLLTRRHELTAQEETELLELLPKLKTLDRKPAASVLHIVPQRGLNRFGPRGVKPIQFPHEREFVLPLNAVDWPSLPSSSRLGAGAFCTLVIYEDHLTLKITSPTLRQFARMAIDSDSPEIQRFILRLIRFSDPAGLKRYIDGFLRILDPSAALEAVIFAVLQGSREDRKTAGRKLQSIVDQHLSLSGSIRREDLTMALVGFPKLAKTIRKMLRRKISKWTRISARVAYEETTDADSDRPSFEIVTARLGRILPREDLVSLQEFIRTGDIEHYPDQILDGARALWEGARAAESLLGSNAHRDLLDPDFAKALQARERRMWVKEQRVIAEHFQLKLESPKKSSRRKRKVSR